MDVEVAARDLARRSRAEQGLPPSITDAATLDLLAALLVDIPRSPMSADKEVA